MFFREVPTQSIKSKHSESICDTGQESQHSLWKSQHSAFYVWHWKKNPNVYKPDSHTYYKKKYVFFFLFGQWDGYLNFSTVRKSGWKIGDIVCKFFLTNPISWKSQRLGWKTVTLANLLEETYPIISRVSSHWWNLYRESKPDSRTSQSCRHWAPVLQRISALCWTPLRWKKKNKIHELMFTYCIRTD